MAADTLPLASQDLHLWLCAREHTDSSDEFKRSVLSRYTGTAPGALQFEEGEHGKPGLVGIERPLDFNLSHSGDWLACAVSGGVPVGVDIEFCNPKRVSLKVARRFFREEEAAWLERSDEDSRAQRFFDFWTLKEAAVKARGDALAPGLSAHGFDLAFVEEASTRGRIEALSLDGARYLLLDPVAGYRLAACWMGESKLSPRLALFELREGGDVQEKAVPLRASNLPR